MTTDHNWHYETGEYALGCCWFFFAVLVALVFVGFVLLLETIL